MEWERASETRTISERRAVDLDGGVVYRLKKQHPKKWLWFWAPSKYGEKAVVGIRLLKCISNEGLLAAKSHILKIVCSSFAYSFFRKIWYRSQLGILQKKISHSLQKHSSHSNHQWLSLTQMLVMFKSPALLRNIDFHDSTYEI